MKAFLEKYKDGLFLLALLVFYIAIDYHHILFYGPKGIHFIRQTDSLSFVVNYLANGFAFFEPMVFNLQSLGGRAAAEFPILYYLTALLYAVFGEHDFILRGLTLIISSIGFLALFRLSFLVLDDIVYAFLFTFLFISSGVVLYYSNNYLPDASALGLSLVGWYYIFRHFYEIRKRRFIIYGMLFFCLASLLKVTCFVNPIAALAAIVFHDLANKRSIAAVVRKNQPLLLTFFAAAVILFAWNYYTILYNALHRDTYFLTSPRPLWGLNREGIYHVWEYMMGYWSYSYYYPSTFHVFIGLLVTGLLFFRRVPKILGLTTLFMVLGSLAYLALFYAQFRDHDYYFLVFIPAFAFIGLHGFTALRNRFPRWINNYLVRSLVLLLCVLSLDYANGRMAHKYRSDDDRNSEIAAELAGAREWIDGLGVPDGAIFIIYTDPTPNGGLYMIRRKGWNIDDDSSWSRKRMESFISYGAEYILSTKGRRFNDPRFEYVGATGQLSLYRIKDDI
jgi:hypothetical protein